MDTYALEHRITQAEANSSLVKEFIKSELVSIDKDISASRDSPDKHFGIWPMNYNNNDKQSRDQSKFENIVFSFPAAKKADRCGVKISE